MSFRHVLGTGAVAALLTLASVAVTNRVRAANTSPPAGPSVAVVARRDFTPRVIAQGSIRLLAGARVVVGAQTSGVVASLPVTEGMAVRRGTVLAQLDTAELAAKLASAEARVAELAAAAAQASADLERTSTLARAGGATLADVASTRTALTTANARLAGARADRDLARIDLGYTTIRAPIDGVVASIATHEGETVAASFAAPAFMTLIAPSRIECVALVDETDIARVRVGDSAAFTVDAYPNREFGGIVTRIAPDASIVGGVVDYEVTVALRGGADLKPQMTTTVTLAGAARVGLVVPTSAVRQAATGAYVWRRRAGRVDRVAVRTGVRQPDVTEILGGLAPGDTVLTGGFPDSI